MEDGKEEKKKKKKNKTRSLALFFLLQVFFNLICLMLRITKQRQHFKTM